VPAMDSDKKIGIYLCTCAGEIERTIDVNLLAKEAEGWRGVAVARKDVLLCSVEGVSRIREDIERLGLDRVLIAACSPFFKEEEFSGLGVNNYLIERVNLREQCSRVHTDNPEHAAKKARVILGISLEKVRCALPLQALQVPGEKSVLVIGGGVAGINAALDIAGTGHEVFLVEKSPFLGGKVAELHRYFPRMCPPSCGLEQMVLQLRANPAIHILTSSQVDAMNGSPGNFEMSVRTSPRYVDAERCTLCGKCLDACPREAVAYPESFSYPLAPAIKRELCADNCTACAESCPADAINLDEEEKINTIKSGALVLATGWEPFDPTPLTELGYGRLENVVTGLEFEKIAGKQETFLRGLKCIAFIQCVGSRDERHLSYCSDVCCMVSLKQAILLKEMNPDSEVYIFYNDIRTPGEYEDFYQKARQAGVIFVKGIPSELKQGETKGISFSVFDTTAGEHLEVSADLVVLATGMKPSDGIEELREKTGVVLNKNNFVESHLQCCPQDTRRAAIFSAGCCKAPMDVSRSIESAGAAAAKALRSLAGGIEVVPDHSVVNTLKCDVCKRCIEECPFKAYALDEKGFPKADILKCRRCGICMGGCPLAAVSLGELSIEQLSEMIDAIDRSYLGEEEPLVLGFMCKNDAYRAADDAGLRGIQYPPNFLGIMVPCAGAVNGAIIAKAISTGIDGVFIAGCPDSQCHYVQGSALAKTRLNDISNKLREMYMEPERVRFAAVGRDEPEKLAQTITDYVRELRGMGRNPLRL